MSQRAAPDDAPNTCAEVIHGAGTRPVERKFLDGLALRRREVLWALFCWDGVDNGLQALRFALLFTHANYRVRAPASVRETLSSPVAYLVTCFLRRNARIALGRALLLASERVANLRRLAHVALWLLLGGEQVAAWCSCGSFEEEESTTADRLAELGEIAAHGGEACDVVAFLTGTGLFWRAFGLSTAVDVPRWFQRRRHGIERVGVFISLAALALQLYAARLRRHNILQSMVQCHEVSQDSKKKAEADHTMPVPVIGGNTRASGTVHENYTHFVGEQRRLRWLDIERVCLYADAVFTTVEACAPDEDKEMLEASTGLLAAVLRLLRLWNEARFGKLGF